MTNENKNIAFLVFSILISFSFAIIFYIYENDKKNIIQIEESIIDSIELRKPVVKDSIDSLMDQEMLLLMELELNQIYEDPYFDELYLNQL